MTHASSLRDRSKGREHRRVRGPRDSRRPARPDRGRGPDGPVPPPDVRDRRLHLPDDAGRGGRPAQRRRRRGRDRRCPRARRAGHAPRGRDRPRRADDQPRHRDRLLEVHAQRAGGLSGGAVGARAARHREQPPLGGRSRARPDVRAGPRYQRARHGRRGHREQLVRAALGDLRQDDRPRPGDRRGTVRRQPDALCAHRRRGAGGQDGARRPGGGALPRDAPARPGARGRDPATVPAHPPARHGLQPRRLHGRRPDEPHASGRRLGGHPGCRDGGAGEPRPRPAAQGARRRALHRPHRVHGGLRPHPGAQPPRRSNSSDT